MHYDFGAWHHRAMTDHQELAQSAGEEGCLTSTVLVGFALVVLALCAFVRTDAVKQDR